MNVKRGVFIFAIVLLAVSYPLYEAIDVALSGGLGGHCVQNAYGSSWKAIGAFCSWGLRIGQVIFGPTNAHLGYALLLGGSAIGFCVFAFWLAFGKPKDPQ